MTRRSQRNILTPNQENGSLDPIDLDSDSELEIIKDREPQTKLHLTSPSSNEVANDDSGRKEKRNKQTSLKSKEKRKRSVKWEEEIISPSPKTKVDGSMHTKNSNEKVKSPVESDSDAEVSILNVVEVPSANKFLRKRVKKHDHTKDARHKPDVPLVSRLEEPKAKVDSDAQSTTKTIIEIDSGSDDELVLAPVSDPSASSKRSSIRLLYNSSSRLINELDDSNNLDTVTINELIGTSNLMETFQFNFNIDLEFFLTHLHPDFSKNKRSITFISGDSHLTSHPLRKQIENKFNISELVVPLPNRFASHHSKMMINFYSGSQLEVVIMTCNLTQLDFGGLTQAVWRSGKLHYGDTTANSGKRFKRDLCNYLKKYKIPRIDALVERLAKFNFNPVEVELVASAPGVYSFDKLGTKDETYGYGKLRQVLHRNDLLIKNSKKVHNVLAQVTSIAYPYSSRKGDTASVFTHLLCPLMFTSWKKQLEPGSAPSQEHQKEFNYKPHIVFPTAEEVATSNFGYLSGTAVHFKFSGSVIHQNQYTQNVKPYLCKWRTSSKLTGRESVTPHVKYYACDNGDNWKSLKWVLVGSHNLSKQAWGYPQVKTHGQSYDVSSYELSVLVAGHKKGLVPVYAQDFSSDPNVTPVRFPFGLPPTKYGVDDKPWSAGEDYGLMKDRWGNLHHGGYSL